MHYLILFFSVAPLFAHASDEAENHCFDFRTKIVNPLPLLNKKAIPPSTSWFKATPEHGNTNDINWAYTSGEIQKPIAELYQKLLNSKTIRGDDGPEVVTKELPNTSFLKLLQESITAKPTFFITIEWVENWAYSLKKGTAENPEEIQISYEKVAGTSHIDRFCGNILLKAVPPVAEPVAAHSKKKPAATQPKSTATTIFLYEEIKASHRSDEDVLNGLSGTLKTLSK